MQDPSSILCVYVAFDWHIGRLDSAEVGVKSWFGAEGLVVLGMQ